MPVLKVVCAVVFSIGLVGVAQAQVSGGSSSMGVGVPADIGVRSGVTVPSPSPGVGAGTSTSGSIGYDTSIPGSEARITPQECSRGWVPSISVTRQQFDRACQGR